MSRILTPTSYGHVPRFGFGLLLAALFICLVAGCIATAPKSRQVTHDALLGKDGGVVLMVDTFVRRDILGGQDYFLIDEAEAGAQAGLAALQKYIEASGIAVRARITSVCAASLNRTNAALRVADKAGAPVREAMPPIRFSPAIPNDPDYTKALSVISTYAFERAGIPKKRSLFDSKDPATNQPPSQISPETFRAAAEVVQARTQASSVLFLGVLGTSISSGKTAAQIAGSVTVGIGSAFATAGLGTGFYLMFLPRVQMDGMVLEGALVNLETGELTWSNAVQSTGDPANPKAIANRQALDLLFHDIMFKPVETSTSASPTAP